MPAERPPESSDSLTLGSGLDFPVNPLGSNPHSDNGSRRTEEQSAQAGEEMDQTQPANAAAKVLGSSGQADSADANKKGLSESSNSTSQSKSGRRRKPRRRSSASSGPREAENTFGVCETANDPAGLGELQDFTGSSYARVEQIGQGGWGTVDRVLDKQLEREVAVKRILGNAAIDEQTRRAFIREAKITSQLQHPGIVPVHDIGREQNGDIFYVMKLLEGSTLRCFIQEKHQELRQQAAVTRYELQETIRPVLERFVSVCDAIAFAHQRGIVHCDIKPANIMIGSFGETTVVDWGLARRTNGEPALPSTKVSQPQRPTRVDEERETGGSAEISGTPAYMAPEQARGEAVTSKSDIYSLGISLFEIVVGTHPYRGHSDVSVVLESVRSGPALDPLADCPQCPRPLAAIVRKATSPAPSDRYSNVQELAAELRRFLAGQKVQAYHESWVETAARWCRKNQALAVTLASSLVVLLVVSMVSTALIAQAHSAEKSARKRAELATAAATERLTAARESADTWLVDLSSALEFYPGLQSLREKLVLQGVSDYQHLLATEVGEGLNQDPEPGDVRTCIASELERAKCHLRLADLFRLQGETAQSDSHTLQAKDTLSSLSEKKREHSSKLSLEELAEFEFMIQLQFCNVAIAELLNPAREVDATEDHEVRSWISEQLNLIDRSASYPSRSHQHKVASVFVRYAIASHRKHKSEAEMSNHLGQAEVWSSWLVEQDPSEGHLRQHETLLFEQAEQYAFLQELDAAEASWHALVAFLTERIDSAENRPELYQSRAYALISLGNLLAQASPSSEARDAFRNAISDLNTAWQLCDADSFYQTNLATAQNNLANLLTQAPETHPEARQLLESSLATYQSLLRQQPSQHLLARLAECHLALARLQSSGPGEVNIAVADHHWQQAKLSLELLKEHYGLSDAEHELWLECGGED